MANNNESHLPSTDLQKAVRAARIELAAAIEALTRVLETVANSDAERTANGHNNDRDTHGHPQQSVPSSQSQRNSAQQSIQHSQLMSAAGTASNANAQEKGNGLGSNQPPSQSQQQSQSQQPQQSPQQHQSNQGQPQQQQVKLDQQSQKQQSPQQGRQQQHSQNQTAQQPSVITTNHPSLEPVLTRINHLRNAVNAVTQLHNEAVLQAQKQEDAVPPQERAALEARRAALIDEVHVKNERMKLLIDNLRELYRDSLTFRNNLNGMYPRNAPSPSKN